MEKNHYIGLILAISIIVILTLGYASNMFGLTNTQTNSYSGDGVSFNVPPNWHVLKKGQGTKANMQIVDNNSNNVQIAISISTIPKNESDQEMISMIQDSMSENSNFEKTSHNTISINGNTAYESTYTSSSSSQSNEAVTDEEVLFIKKGMLYDIIFEAPVNEFNSEQTNFNITLNSFKIQ